jgi:Phosphate-induced protein 1 conserved region
MESRFSVVAASLLVWGAIMAPTIALAQDKLNGESKQDTRPDGRGNHTRNQIGHAASGGAVVQGNGINYHGGPVLHNTVDVYFIWYGNWGSEFTTANTILTNWATSIGGSPYENINTTYGDATGNVSGAIALKGSTSDAGSQGSSLSDSSIASIVSKALSSGALPADSNGVYFVLTAPGVTETSGFLTQYCGWHTYGTYNGAYIQYAFVGDAAGPSLGNCAAQTASSPNGDPGVDAMVSVISHELEESASDPELNAWYDSNGEENADKCAWTFGATYNAKNGSFANMKLGGMDYLIQQNWVNAAGGYCALSYTATPDFSLSVSPTSQSVTAGGTTASAYIATATPLNNWSGSVNYAVTSALPSGASATVSGNSITISTSTTTPPGSYNFTITGTDAAHSLTHTTTATLVVNPLPTATFIISVTPISSTTVHRPGSASYTVTITPQNGFASDVTLSASPTNKTGLSYAFSPTSVTGGSGTSTLTATVTTSARRGGVTITVTAKGGGVTKSATTSLQIQ